jgi:recombination protein RecA
MRTNLALLRSQIESALAGRITAPFTYRDRKPAEIVSTGIPEIDALAGGLPRGGLTEICAPPCSGGTSLLVSTLAARTSSSEVCALIDGCDTFDPYSAQAAGVALQQLLWVRCRNIDQAFRATDLLIQGGGFGLIALDLSGIPPETVRHVPLNVWFRFRRAVEDTPSSLVVLEQESNAKTCASLVLQLAMGRAHWSTTLDKQAANPFQHSPACLLDGYEVHAGILRSRMNVASLELNVNELNRSELKTGTSNEPFPSQSPVLQRRSPDRAGVALESLSSMDRNAIFITRSIWSFPATREPDQENDNR